MKKLSKKGAHPVRFAPNDRYTVARDPKVNIFDEYVSEQDRSKLLRVRNMLNTLLEEK